MCESDKASGKNKAPRNRFFGCERFVQLTGIDDAAVKRRIVLQWFSESRILSVFIKTIILIVLALFPPLLIAWAIGGPDAERWIIRIVSLAGSMIVMLRLYNLWQRNMPTILMREGRCPHCGYKRHPDASERCPECGKLWTGGTDKK